LIAQFAKALEADILGGAPATAAAQAGTTAPTAETLTAASQPAASDSVDLLKVVAVPMAKRFAPALGALVAGAVIGFLMGRRRNRRTDDLLDALSRLVS
jgi:hypothetical protein